MGSPTLSGRGLRHQPRRSSVFEKQNLQKQNETGSPSSAGGVYGANHVGPYFQKMNTKQISKQIRPLLSDGVSTLSGQVRHLQPAGSTSQAAQVLIFKFQKQIRPLLSDGASTLSGQARHLQLAGSASLTAQVLSRCSDNFFWFSLFQKLKGLVFRFFQKRAMCWIFLRFTSHKNKGVFSFSQP